MRTIDEVCRRIRAEYTEMPGLRLTPAQVERLCGVDRKTCQLVLDELVNDRFLRASPDGHYARLADDTVQRPQLAKARLRTQPRLQQAS